MLNTKFTMQFNAELYTHHIFLVMMRVLYTKDGLYSYNSSM